MAKTNNKIKWWGVLLISIGSLFALILTVWGAINILKFPIYSEYYSLKQELFKLPDIHNNFVPQGIEVWSEMNQILISGYFSKTFSISYCCLISSSSLFSSSASCACNSSLSSGLAKKSL